MFQLGTRPNLLMLSPVFIPCCAADSLSARVGALEYYYLNWGLDGYLHYSQASTLLSKEKEQTMLKVATRRPRAISVAVNGHSSLETLE